MENIKNVNYWSEIGPWVGPRATLGTLEKSYFAPAVSQTMIFSAIYQYSDYAVPAPNNYTA